jgi:hypothetical protein
MFAESEWPVVTAHRLGERHWLTRRIPRRDRQWYYVAVDSRQHSLAQLALDATLDEQQVVVHDARLVTVAITLVP